MSSLYLLFLVRLGGYIVNSFDCYSYRLIGKLTDFLQNFRSLTWATKLWTIPLPSRDVLGPPESKSRYHPVHQSFNFTYYTQYWWVTYHFKNTYSPITLGNTFSVTPKGKVGSTLTKAEVLPINLNDDGVSITSKTHTHLHPSHSQTSRLLTSSLSLGVPVPRVTQCIWDV
jgi:hypothetical protein